jgi:Carboxypeptidase regulatory-like domain
MSLGSLIVLNTVFLIAAAQKECNQPATAESNVSCSASARRVESRDPYPGLSYLQVGAESDTDGLESVSIEADGREDPQQPARDRQNASISGTVADENGDVIPDAEVVLAGDGLTRNVISNDTGFFELRNLPPSDSYHLIVTANGFATWKSNILQLDAGQFLIVDNIKLKLAGAPVSVTVTASPTEIATEQVRMAEHQRVLGFIPNFLVVYDRNPAPLTPKLKFELALRVAVDPVTFIGVGGFAAINQAASTPNYVEGLKGYGQRAGALYADGLTDLMLGGAILPSLLHQDPRYFYQGTGSKRSRMLHALFSPFVCRGDNGKWQPNYSSLGGNLASTAISEAYYPSSNRGYGLVFGDFLIGTGERMASNLAQEFLLRKLTPSAAKNSNK